MTKSILEFFLNHGSFTQVILGSVAASHSPFLPPVNDQWLQLLSNYQQLVAIGNQLINHQQPLPNVCLCPLLLDISCATKITARGLEYLSTLPALASLKLDYS